MNLPVLNIPEQPTLFWEGVADSPAVFRFIFVMKHCQLSRAINYGDPLYVAVKYLNPIFGNY